MQYHIDDYVIGDPDVKPTSDHSVVTTLPDTTDVLIVGSGPAGLTLAAQLAAFPDVRCCLIERRPQALERGQADGVACRTMEMFNAFGFAHQVLREAYWVNETAFWRTHDNPEAGIYRSGRVQDTEDGLSEFPHVILNQARVHQFYLDVMRKSPQRSGPWYGHALTGFELAPEATDYPVRARVRTADQQDREVQARYLVGCDGARSLVREQLGLALEGDFANQAWGVMDVLAVTDFPDIRLKCIINAAEGGSVVLIPREGGYLVRIYVEMEKLGASERVRQRAFDANDIIAAANRVFHPYQLDVRHVAWWSVYEIGQRITPRFDNLGADGAQPGEPDAQPRVFITGDACHTHSPKAGQGMNVSMQDSFNLGWKLAAVLRGQSPPTLLRTYQVERHAVARELIEFDRQWAALLHAASRNDGSVSAAEVQRYFERSGRYTAGTATHYEPSELTDDASRQHLAPGLVIGMRFHSAPVVRLADGKPMHLGHVQEADGRWRLLLFAPATETPSTAMAAIERACDALQQGVIKRFTPPGRTSDAVIDVRAVLPFDWREFSSADVPDFLQPRKGRFALRDYERVFCTGPGPDIYTERQIDRQMGCQVIVRPDQYISRVLKPISADHG